MAVVIEINDARDGYVDLVRWVYERGADVAPRGHKTREIEDATIVIANPYDTLPLGVGRGASAAVGAIEAMQLLAGTTYPELLVRVAPQFVNYAEADGSFWGPYGVRTGYQVQHVIDRLRNDPDSRQAVMTFWDPELDLQPDKKDYPCTILHQYRIRDGRLNLSVYMRSNDVWKGAAYDFFQFTRMQIAIANILDCEVGTYAHHVGSLHIYESDYDKVGNLKYADGPIQIPVITRASWTETKQASKDVLDAVENPDKHRRLDPAQQWYADAMQKALTRHAAQ